MSVFLLGYATVDRLQNLHRNNAFSTTSAIFYLKTLLRTLNASKDSHFDVELATAGPSAEFFLNDHAENGGRIIGADRDYIKVFGTSVI
ncbi:hypothetical protein AVEN_241252-1 [Araneus ventricosus]|uniref:Uncharacterized protein n=1 Tax=Araneus ventricosus TaxID=182803 RepID=A0A4Y2PAX5_ARAVE|nr:hypothetical protein AVEN_241252-1 [Araneus ventricosus]